MQDDDDDDDEDEEDDFLPNDIKNGEKIDRPKDLMDSPFLFNFPNPFEKKGNNATSSGDDDFNKKLEEEEKQYKIDHGYALPSPGKPEFEVKQKGITKPVYKEKLAGIFREFSWYDSSPSILTGVRDQGKTCASSYAFAVTAALEAAQALENQEGARRLSEQQFIDCTFDGHYNNFGCLGGHLENTLKYAEDNLILEGSLYKYKGMAGICKYSELQKSKDTSKSYVLNGFKKIESNSPLALKTALNDGPVVASIKAGNVIFKNYA